MGVCALAGGCVANEGGVGNEGEVVVTGRALNIVDRPAANAQVTLEHYGAVARTRTDKLGRFVLRLEPTDELEAEQEDKGYIGFRVTGLYYVEGRPCESYASVRVRFQQGRWLDRDTGKPASILLRRFQCLVLPPVTVCC